MMMWKIVGGSEASVLYIYIYIDYVFNVRRCLGLMEDLLDFSCPNKSLHVYRMFDYLRDVPLVPRQKSCQRISSGGSKNFL